MLLEVSENIINLYTIAAYLNIIVAIVCIVCLILVLLMIYWLIGPHKQKMKQEMKQIHMMKRKMQHISENQEEIQKIRKHETSNSL